MGYGGGPFTGPYMRGLELRGFIDDLHAKREERELRKQAMQQQIEERQRRSQMEDLQTRMALHSMGALPVEEGVQGKFHAAISGAGKAFDSPVGSYALPGRRSPEELQQQAIDQARQKGMLAGEQKKAEASVYNPKGDEEDVFVPREIAGGFGANVPQKKADYLLKVHEALEKKHPDGTVKMITNRESGDVQFVKIPAGGGEPQVIKTLKGAAGRGKAAGATGGLSAGAQRAMDRAQKLIDLANATTDAEKEGTISKPGQADIAERRWAAAATAVEQAMKAFPNELKGTLGTPQVSHGRTWRFAAIEPHPKAGGGGVDEEERESDDSGDDAIQEPDLRDPSTYSGGKPNEDQDAESAGKTAGEMMGRQITKANLISFARRKGANIREVMNAFTQAGGQIV